MDGLSRSTFLYWTVRLTPDGEDHLYLVEWPEHEKTRSYLACTGDKIEEPCWYRSDMLYELQEGEDKVFKYKYVADLKRLPYPDLNMCPLCLRLRIMTELAQ